MALPKVCGIETEYGIVVRRGEQPGPRLVAADQRLRRRHHQPQRAGTSTTSTRQRRPRLLARRRRSPPRSRPPSSTPCSPTAPGTTSTTPTRRSPPRGRHRARGRRLGPRRRGDRPPTWSTPRPSWPPARPARRGHRPQEQLRRQGQQLRLPRELPAGSETPFGRIVAQVTPHFVTRQIFAGAGKVGCELPGVPNDHVPYQLSQRADFFEEEVGLETTLKRPIVNTRDEPHCDAQKYRRLHVIVGDANMSEVATYLKVGTTAIVLAMIEDDALGRTGCSATPSRRSAR